ncbi:MAG: hypothetical protein JW863_07380 [Chitinispirillaceae bacterium]|nr:hypothetical protein [Chitinispirillaceae bacterium]
MNKATVNRLLITMISVFLIASLAGAEWEQTNGPFFGWVSSLTECGSYIFAGTHNGQVFRSADKGTTWKNVSAGLPSKMEISKLATDSQTVYAVAIDIGLFASRDYGEHWTALDLATNLRLGSIAFGKGIIFVGSGYWMEQGIYCSTNGGVDWARCNSGLKQTDITSLAVSGETVFAGTADSGMFRSNIDSLRWRAVNNGLPVDTSWEIILDTIGENPDTVTVKADTIRHTRISTITDIEVAGTTIYIATWSKGVFKSTDNGENWTYVGTGQRPPNLSACCVNGNTIFAGAYRLTGDGQEWEAMDINGSSGNTFDILVSDEAVFAGTWKGICRSTDNGETWAAINNGFANTTVTSLLLRGDAVFAATGEIGYGVFVSRNHGETWMASNNGLTTNGIVEIHSMVMSGATIFATTNTGPLAYSLDEGKNWSRAKMDPFPTTDLTCLVLIDTMIIAGSMSKGFAISTDTGSTWTVSGSGQGSISSINSMVAKDGIILGATTWSGMVRSTDTGKTWTYVKEGLTDDKLNTLALHNGIFFAGSSDSGVFCSNDDGATWTPANNGMTKRRVRSFATNNSTLLAGCDGGGVFISLDDGMHWHEAGTGLMNNNITSLVFNESTVYAGTENRSVWRRPLSELMDAAGVKSGRINSRHREAIVTVIHNPGQPLSIGIRLYRNDKVLINLYDLAGRMVASLVEKDLPAGNHHFFWNAGLTSTGCYLVEARAGKTVLMKSIPVFR